MEHVAVPLEETQLDHVLHGSEARRKEQLKELEKGKRAWQLDATPVPAELSVDRHAPLEQIGRSLRRAHLSKIAAIAGHFDELTDSDGEETRPGDGGDSPGPSPLSSTFPMGRYSSQQEHSQDEEPAEPDSPGPSATLPAAKRGWRAKSLVIARMNLAKEDHRLRREREAKALKMRQETLTRKVCIEPLPKELSERKLTTTWVSPAIASLAGEMNREVLRKPSAEAFTLKMELRSAALQKNAHSMPSLRSVSKAVGSPKAADERNATDGSARHGSSSPSSRCKTPGDTGRAATTATLPRVALGSRRITIAMPAERTPPGHVVSLQPPARLSPDVVEQRIEADDQGFQKLSFAIYRQEHDVLTGVKKWSMDGQKLRDSEEAYVKHMREMVGGRPKSLIAPEAVALRRRPRETLSAALSPTSAGVVA
mmetsp:Transcript_76115/g.221012  ORF Transcript_76115/g.221012 Transcript_76115/m.221012 type:complete len:425 (-) Transcript_76115:111-1385(-)